ncbi:mitochondrial import protein Pam17-domain-containing protein [Lasiosphaeris hirsuta]|uniref:Presequence translocated-associated motor subunit PAM17 n=1 Tax=Lasiosphaeris hirsuta TaxID=260670 RepID=A0AA40E7C1_9PEZI|nr:mitochondrial import protein Pam17-domain-containing protein [Lasiosphaeris hirsuta]
MLTSTATMIRSGVGRSVALPPVLFRGSACPYSTAIISPFSMGSKPSRPSKPSPTRQATCIRALSTAASPTPSPSPFTLTLRVRTQPPRRNASSNSARPRTDAEVDASAAEAAASAQVASHPGQEPLDWNTFFKLRKTRRRLQQVFGVVIALAGGTSGAILLGTSLGDSIVGNVPLDPMVTMGLVTFSCAALGWLVGPIMGTVIFNAMKGKFKGQMAVKESQFFVRIKKHRVDPTLSSMNNPVPDFYGEKISSVAGYRQWLKDQRAYIKKRSNFL